MTTGRDIITKRLPGLAVTAKPANMLALMLGLFLVEAASLSLPGGPSVLAGAPLYADEKADKKSDEKTDKAQEKTLKADENTEKAVSQPALKPDLTPISVPAFIKPGTRPAGPALTARQRSNQQAKDKANLAQQTAPLGLAGVDLKTVPALPLGNGTASLGNDLDHLTLSLRDGVEKQTGDASPLLTLKEADGASVRVQSRGISGLRSIGAIFDQSTGVVSTPPGGLEGSEVGLLLGGDLKSDGTVSETFEIALQGSYAITDALSGDKVDANAVGLETRDVNLGLRLGYSGFNIDASLLQHNAALAQDSFGFEAGLSYETGAFMARVAAREYRAGLDLQGVENEYRRYISYEFGARYRLTDKFGLSGGFRYFEFDDHWLANPTQGENSQMIFLGGSFSF